MTTDYWTRILKHMKNSIVIMTPIYGFGLLVWYIFLKDILEFKEASIYSGLFSAWVFVFINLKYKLPHYNIPDSSTDEYKLLIYRIDVYMVSISIIVLIFMKFFSFPT